MSNDFSPVGYQTRSKSKKKADPNPGKVSAPKPRPELSKHQLKKMARILILYVNTYVRHNYSHGKLFMQEKQARKATRTASKKSLNKFLSEDRPSSPTEHSLSVENLPTVDAQESSVNQEQTNVKELEDAAPKESEGLDKDSETTDIKQDGVSVDSTLNTEIPTTVSIDQPVAETDNSNMNMTRHDVDGYAADGPVLDTNSMSEPREGGNDLGLITTADSECTSNLEETMEQQETANIETAQAIEESEPVQAVSSPNVESNTTSLAAGPEPESLVRRFKSLNVDPDSLEASLKKFSTPEQLTGANKFACVVCTKLKYEGQSEITDSNSPPKEEEATKNEAMDDKAIEEDVPSDSNSRDTCEVKVDTEEKTQEDVTITNKLSNQQSSVSEGNDVVADFADDLFPAEDDSTAVTDIVVDDECQEDTDSRGKEDNNGRADSSHSVDDVSAHGNEDSFEQSAGNGS